VSRVHDFSKCCRSVSKQINPLQVDNLITNKSPTILEASRKILHTRFVKISVLAIVKKLKKNTMLLYRNQDSSVV
jgi:hypothetical protein